MSLGVLRWIDPLLDRASRLVPDVLWRLDRSMLERYPLLWRSRLLSTLCIVTVLTAAAACAGLAIPMTAQDVWTANEVLSAVRLFEMAMLAVAGLWATVQTRYSIGACGWQALSRVFLYSFLVLVALMLPPQAFYGGVGTRIAGVMTPEELQRHIAFHEPYKYWCCSRRLDQARIEDKRPELAQMLGALGLTTSGTLYLSNDKGFGSYYVPSVCPGQLTDDWSSKTAPPIACLDMRDNNFERRAHLLRERLESIQKHQALDATNLPLLVNAAQQRIRGWALAAALVAFIMTLHDRRSHARRRRFALTNPVVRLARSAARCLLPDRLLRLDRQLLLNQPIGWASRVHVFVPWALIVGIVLFGLVVFLEMRAARGSADFLQDEDSPLVFTLFYIAASTGFWLTVCRIHTVPAVEPAESFRLMKVFVFSVMAVPVALGSAAILITKGDFYDVLGKLTVFLGVAAGVLIPAAWVANFAGKLVMGTGILVSASVFVTPFLLENLLRNVFGSSNAAIVAVTLAFAVLWTIAERTTARHIRRGGVNPARARTALALLCAAAPAVMSMLTIAVVVAVLEAYDIDRPPIGAAFSLTFIAALFVTFRWILRPTLAALARIHYLPATE